MNPNLNLLLTILTTHKTLIHVALEIPERVNEFPYWDCYRESDVHNDYLSYLPEHISSQTDVILDVQKLDHIVK